MKCNANTDILRGRKIEIYPTDIQKEKIQKCIDITRAVYNLGLEIQNKIYEEQGKGSYIHHYNLRIIGNLRNNDPNYKWLQEIQMSTIRESLLRLDNAFKRFFSHQNCHPRYHSKKKSKKSFTVRSDRTIIKNDRFIQIPDLGLVDCKNHNIPIDTKVYNTVITFDEYNRYYLSFNIEDNNIPIDMSDIQQTDAVGIDVGIRNMITTSDGDYYHFSNTKKHEKRLKRQQKRLSKHYNRLLEESLSTRTKYEDIPKSKNMWKLLYEQHKTYNKIHNKRMNDIHTATKRIVEKNPSCIVIEDISVENIVRKNKWFNKYKPQAMFYEIHRQLQYKAEDRNIPVIKADNDYPSSQLCSNCGNIYKTTHSIYRCPVCGLIMDRDLNAALNLKKLAYQ